jgi:glycosyltransferase involved in cell wall biosynthesis
MIFSKSRLPLHVVVYTDALGVGGAEISLGHLVAQVSRDIKITVLGVSLSVVGAIAQQRPAAVSQVLSTGRLASMAHLMALHQLQPDIVHLNLCTPWASAIGLAAALTLPQARVVCVHQLPLRTTAAIVLWRTRWLALRVDAQVAVGTASARRLEDFYALGRRTVFSVPNGVPDRVTPWVQRANPALIVGSVGRLDAMKAYDILLRAIAQIEGMQLVILGEGEQRAALEQLARDLGIYDRVKLPGWVSDPHAYLASFDIFVLPSRSEGFPLAIVEAMLAARPVIATNVGSVAEAVRPEQTGLLIEPDDVIGLVAALRRLQADASLRDRWGQQGRQVALANFTASQMAQRYEQIWQDVCQKPQVPRLRVPRPRD